MRRDLHRRLALLLAVLAAGALGACGVQIDTRREGFPCDPDGGCASGLVCSQGACVAPDHVPAGGGDGGAVTDGGSGDAGVVDAGTSDGGATDGGLVDGGAGDGGLADGGTLDGGASDGGTADGGPACTPAAALSALTPAGETTVLPWDTVTLDPTGTDTCGAAVTATYQVSPAPARGGLGPWGHLAPSYTPATPLAPVTFYTDTPGDYVITLRLAGPGPGQVHTATTTVTVAGLAPLPYGAMPADASTALALDPGTGDLLVATSGGLVGAVLFTAGASTGGGTLLPLPCLDSRHSSAAAFDGTHFWVGFQDRATVNELTQIGSASGCQRQPYTPQFNVFGTPSRTQGLGVVGATVYDATDRGLFGFNGSAFAAYPLSALGNRQDVAAVVPDLAGQLWIAANGTPDGAIRTPAPPSINAILYSYLPVDDRIRDAVAGQTAGGTDQMWLGTSGNGIIQIPDVTAPGTGTVWSTANGALPPGNNYDQVNGGGFDPITGDVWFATPGGLLRYKADLGVVTDIPLGEAGLDVTATGNAVVLDAGNGRGRVLYEATQAGVYQARGR